MTAKPPQSVMTAADLQRAAGSCGVSAAGAGRARQGSRGPRFPCWGAGSAGGSPPRPDRCCYQTPHWGREEGWGGEGRERKGEVGRDASCFSSDFVLVFMAMLGNNKCCTTYLVVMSEVSITFSVCVCVCVCMICRVCGCQREKERETEREKEREKERETERETEREWQRQTDYYYDTTWTQWVALRWGSEEKVLAKLAL